MTADDIIEKHCSNCMAYAENRRAWDPQGRVYWVCDNCRDSVESGDALVVTRNDDDPR